MCCCCSSCAHHGCCCCCLCGCAPSRPMCSSLSPRSFTVCSSSSARQQHCIQQAHQQLHLGAAGSRCRPPQCSAHARTQANARAAQHGRSLRLTAAHREAPVRVLPVHRFLVPRADAVEGVQHVLTVRRVEGLAAAAVDAAGRIVPVNGICCQVHRARGAAQAAAVVAGVAADVQGHAGGLAALVCDWQADGQACASDGARR